MKSTEEKSCQIGIPEEVPVPGFQKKPHLLLVTTSGVVGSLVSSFIVFTIYSLIGHDKLYYDDCFLDLKWHIFYTLLLGLLIGISISYGVRKSRYTNIKAIFNLTVLCIILAYLIFNFAVFITYSDFDLFLFPSYLLSTADKHPLRFYLPFNGIRLEEEEEMYKYTDYIMRFYKIFTQGKLAEWTQHPEEWTLAPIINMQVWVIQFLITFSCSWKLVNLIYPWLPAQTCPDKKSWLAFLTGKLWKKDTDKENFEEK